MLGWGDSPLLKAAWQLWLCSCGCWSSLSRRVPGPGGLEALLLGSLRSCKRGLDLTEVVLPAEHLL